MDLAECEFEELAYKCNFCDVIFLSLESILKHKRLFCHKRRRLPRSCTVTTAMLKQITAPDGQLALQGDSRSQLHESSATKESEVHPVTGISPESKLSKVVTQFLQDRHANSTNNDSETEGKSPGTSFKRKRSSTGEGSETDSTFSSPLKQKKF